MKASTRSAPALAAVLIAAAALAAPSAPSEGPPLSGRFAQSYRVIEEPELVPDYAFEDGEGADRALVEFRGKVVVAMFWASWCGICAREVPKLAALQTRLGGDGLHVAPLAQDGDRASIRAWLRERGAPNLPAYRDVDSLLATLLGIRGVPTSFVIDKRGRMVGVVQGGADWNSDEAVALLRHYLDE